MDEDKREPNKKFVMFRSHYPYIHRADEQPKPNELCLEVYGLVDPTGLPLFMDRQSRFISSQYKQTERLAVIAERCLDKNVYLIEGDTIETIKGDIIIVGVEQRLQVDLETLGRFEHAMRRIMKERGIEWIAKAG